MHATPRAMSRVITCRITCHVSRLLPALIKLVVYNSVLVKRFLFCNHTVNRTETTGAKVSNVQHVARGTLHVAHDECDKKNVDPIQHSFILCHIHVDVAML